MYEISELKSKKLPDLQVIAKSIGVKRITGLKKMDLIYQIIDFVSANPDAIKKAPKTSESKPVINDEKMGLNRNQQQASRNHKKIKM